MCKHISGKTVNCTDSRWQWITFCGRFCLSTLFKPIEHFQQWIKQAVNVNMLDLDVIYFRKGG